MKTNYVLIDLENVQPKNLEILKGHDFKILVFVGEKQARIPFELASALQAFGTNAEYIKIEGSGPNALDFHIAFYIGYIVQHNPNSYFHIISKDTGFDPLVRHLKSKKISAQRHKDVSDIPILKIVSATTKKEKISTIIEFLHARGNGKPRTIVTLGNAINSLFMKKLEQSELDELIIELCAQSYIIENAGKVSYKLPTEP